MWRPKHVELETFQEKRILYIQLDLNKTYEIFHVYCTFAMLQHRFTDWLASICIGINIFQMLINF
jgi:hypothetical protein